MAVKDSLIMCILCFTVFFHRQAVAPLFPVLDNYVRFVGIASEAAGHPQAATHHAAVRAATFAGSRAAATPGHNAAAKCLGDGMISKESEK